MAIVPIRQTSFIPTPFSDSKAGGYVSIFTAQGWDQWRQAVESLSQIAADNQLAYEKKLKTYEAITKAIATQRGDLDSKLADIQAKKADVLAKYALKNADLLQKAKRDAAQIPSERTSYSGRWSQSSGRTLWTPSYGPDGTPASTSAGGAGVPVSPANLKIIQDWVNTAGMTDDERKTEIARDLVTAGLPESTAQDMAASAMKDKDFVSGMQISPGQAEAGRRSSGSAGVAVSSSTGQTWKDYTPAEIDATKDPAIIEYNKAIEELQAKLSDSGLDLSNIAAPVLEPIDLITTARQIYKEKFGDVPVPTNLRIDGSVVAVLNNLMPFEVTNGMNKSIDFFKRYIDAEVSAARKAAGGRELNVNELNHAVEAGKKRARQVLFGIGAPGGDVSNELSGKTETVEGDPSAPKTAASTTPDVTPPTPNTNWEPWDPGSATFNNEPTGDQPKPSSDQTAKPMDLTEPFDPKAEYKNRLKRELDALQYNYKTPPIPQSTMQPTSGTADAVPSLPPHTYFPTRATYIGQKTEGEIPSYEAPIPGGNYTPEGRPQPALIPYSLPPSGLSLPYWKGTGLEFVPPKPQWMPTPQPGLMPGKSPGMEPIHKTKVLDLDEASTQHKVDAFVAGTKAATENPKGTAKALVKDSIGQFVSTLFDENKSKGPNAKPVSTITEQLIKEYSGQPEKQKKAIQRYVELSTLDANSKRIG